MFQSEEKFNAMCADLAQTYGVATVEKSFAVTVPMTQTLINEVQESDAFLKQVSIITTTDSKGEIVTLGLSRRLASRTDTTVDGAKRVARTITEKTGRSYEVNQVEFDYALTYNDLDVWNRYDDYATRVAGMVNRACALDLLYIGWWGEADTATTDLDENPLLQDVAKGWYTILKEEYPENYISKEGDDAMITLGLNGDYKNLDQMAFDLLMTIPKIYRDKTQKVLLGDALLAYETDLMFGLHGTTPTEKQAMQALNKKLAGMEVENPSGFPDYGMMVTAPGNLQIYLQLGSVRKKIKDEPERNQVEHYSSKNLDWSIGELKACVAINHAQLELGMTTEVVEDDDDDDSDA